MSELILDVQNLEASYGPVRVLHGVHFTVRTGEIALLLGANGAGKTTTLRAISGSVSASGSVTLQGTSILGMSPSNVAKAGIAHVPQGRGTLTELTVEDNLLAGAINRKDRPAVAAEVREWYERFPVLGKRRTQLAGLLSGGEQQMLAIARAMMGKPALLMLDEPSLGLAPKIVGEIFSIFSEINKSTGTSMLVVEQNAEIALAIADCGFVLEVGRTVLEGPASDLQSNPEVQHAYLGGDIAR
ncbi:ABC transporter ATP-binding protein [Paeniglutamicibacter sp. MACA_103]|uniref:ABC transporter ATP-binding protein n=1 Tax=Paeniglutamicibacter sp. MACA_103 TaxID=3377337 RepID=UPI0038941389